MNTPDFNLRPTIFSENEQAFLKEVTAKLEKACLNCEDCDWCIFTDFCKQVKYDDGRYDNGTTTPSELLTKIFSKLGVDV